MKNKSIFFVLIIILAAAAVFIHFSFKHVDSAAIKTTGIVEGQEVNISSMIFGRIIWDSYNEGDKVEKDAQVILLDNKELIASVNQAEAALEKSKTDVTVYSSAIASYKAELDSVKADIESAMADITNARLELEESKRNYERYRNLYEKKVISLSVYDDANTKYLQEEAAYKSAQARGLAAKSKQTAAEAQLNMAENQLTASNKIVKQAEANLAVIQAKLDEAIIKSPIDGTVVFKYYEKGEIITQGVPILTIVDLNNLYVRINLEETLIDKISIRKKVVLRTTGDKNYLFNGEITEIGKLGDFAVQKDVTGGRQDIHTFRVKLSVKDPEKKLKPGMTVEVEIPLEAAK